MAKKKAAAGLRAMKQINERLQHNRRAVERLAKTAGKKRVVGRRSAVVSKKKAKSAKAAKKKITLVDVLLATVKAREERDAVWRDAMRREGLHAPEAADVGPQLVAAAAGCYPRALTAMFDTLATLTGRERPASGMTTNAEIDHWRIVIKAAIANHARTVQGQQQLLAVQEQRLAVARQREAALERSVDELKEQLAAAHREVAQYQRRQLLAAALLQSPEASGSSSVTREVVCGPAENPRRE